MVWSIALAVLRQERCGTRTKKGEWWERRLKLEQQLCRAQLRDMEEGFEEGSELIAARMTDSCDDFLTNGNGNGCNEPKGMTVYDKEDITVTTSMADTGIIVMIIMTSKHAILQCLLFPSYIHDADVTTSVQCFPMANQDE